VFDNNSSNTDVLGVVESDFPEVKVLRSPQNLGYAGACNALLEKMSDGICVLANMDLEFSANWGKEIERSFSEKPNAAAVGSLVMLSDKETINSAGVKFFPDINPQNDGDGQLLSTLNVEDLYRIPSCYGAVIAIQKHWWIKAGPFADEYFLFFEETEWFIRLAVAGGEVWMNPQALVYHFRSMATVRYSLSKLFYSERNRVRTLLRHFPFWYWPQAYFWAIRRYYLLSRKGVPQNDAQGNKHNTIRILWELAKAWFIPLFEFKSLFNARKHLKGLNPNHERVALNLIRSNQLQEKDLVL